MPDTGLLFALGAIIAAVVVTAVAAWYLFNVRGKRDCPHCGAALTGGSTCPVCGAPAGTIDAHPGAGPYGYGEPDTSARVKPGTHDPEVGYLNAGLTKRIVVWATVAMIVGLGVRVVGMAPAIGVHFVVPDGALAVISILGGIVAFVGFAILDAA